MLQPFENWSQVFDIPPTEGYGFVFPPLESELTCDCSDLCSVVGMALWLLSLGPQRPRAWVS